jgi:hypothetical protein
VFTLRIDFHLFLLLVTQEGVFLLGYSAF